MPTAAPDNATTELPLPQTLVALTVAVPAAGVPEHPVATFTVPDTDSPLENTYQVPAEPPPQLTMRKVIVVVAGTFCNASIVDRVTAGNAAPLLEVLL